MAVELNVGAWHRVGMDTGSSKMSKVAGGWNAIE